MMDIRSEKQDADNLRLAQETARDSLDPSTKVGGVLLLRDGTRIKRCNEFMTMTNPDAATREERMADVLHAEDGVLLEVGQARAQDAWYYGTHEPCGRCWRLLAWAGVSRVVYVKTDVERRQRWGCDDRGAIEAKAAIRERGGILEFDRL